MPAKVIAYLQAHPETDYVWGAFGNLTLGVPQAIKTAGLSEKVKVVTHERDRTGRSRSAEER